MFDKELLIKKFSELLEASFGDSKQDTPVHVESELEVVKSLDTMERRALFVVLAPQEGDTTEDLHGDTYTAEEVEKACISFNTHCMKAGAYHAVELSSDLAVIEQSFCTPATFVTDTGLEIRKGSWLQWWNFPAPDDGEADLIWPQVLDGTFTGVSIQCGAQGYNLND
jgi:hypothetical protein